jgi:inhibitor of KinA sporulation pathway (predicted exonuclease)
LNGKGKRIILRCGFKLIDFQNQLMKICKLRKHPSLIKTIEMINKSYRLKHHDPLNDAKMLKSIYKKYKKFPREVKMVLRRAEYEEDLIKLQQKYKDVLPFQLEELIM